MKYNDNGEYKDIYVKAFDTLPVGAIVEYSGSTIPSGWTDIGNNQIQKTSQYIEGGATLSNEYGTSQSNGYSQEYINRLETYSTTEQRIGTWIDGKPLYRKVVSKSVTISNKYTTLTNILNVDTVVNLSGTIKGSDGETITPVCWITNTNSPIQNWCIYFYKSNNELNLYKSADFNVTLSVNIIIEYTKTTD